MPVHAITPFGVRAQGHSEEKEAQIIEFSLPSLAKGLTLTRSIHICMYIYLITRNKMNLIFTASLQTSELVESISNCCVVSAERNVSKQARARFRRRGPSFLVA